MPSIRKADADRGGRGDLIQAVRGNANKHFVRLNTPTAQDAKNSTLPPSQEVRDSLVGDLLKGRVGTPRASDGMKNPMRDIAEDHNCRSRLEDQVAQVEGPGGSLNPGWVEWLMGWPIGWTDLRPLAMDRFQQWRRSHGAFCLRVSPMKGGAND